MTVVLACPWQPRGELARLKRFHDRLTSIYDYIVVALIEEDAEIIAALKDMDIKYAFYQPWSGRHVAMELALQTSATHIHYVDMDRLVRWVETRPDELAEVVKRLQTVDCLVTGRTPQAYETHSRTLIDTERLPNTFFSHWFGRKLDLLSGSRGFHRRAMEFILKHSSERNAFEMDAAWLVLVQRGGFTWDVIEVDGLDWETADHYQNQAATREQQRTLAEEQDQNAELWSMRVKVAQDITDLALKAIEMELETES